MLQTSKIIGIAADHGGHTLKAHLVSMLRETGAEVIDFGDQHLVTQDDYPDFVVPLAQAVAAGRVDRGVAICGSGVGACVAANKVDGVRACLIHDSFSAHQGVEDDDLNMICFGGQVVGPALAWELLQNFLNAHFSAKERHRRRLRKVSELEKVRSQKIITAGDFSGKNPTRGPAPLKLYLIRHGETEWTFTDRHTGVTDLPLTALGEDEVREWGDRFCGIQFSHVLTSPRQRARRTFELVEIGKVAELEDDLSEWDYGDYEGMKSVEIRKERTFWNVFRDGCPNGESPEEISDRADRLILKLRKMTGNIALFSHGQFGSVLAARWIGLSVAEAQHFPLGTASLGVLGYNPHHHDVPVLELWNSAPHEASRLACSPKAVEQMPAKQQDIQRWEDEGGDIPGAQPSDQ
ncbi:RpiB/LacA/LacB family sugar-phosphate isomerase [Akkermansiaceae bacterium]|nr:RpiB/LacA/LacB family sugar-phosphate isomerase [Akkermansiaceae bacterium]MDA7891284.1 RpiB/LacA/LacB family sugar-phosphate isomerase [Akkermansiaceae bacterium]MDA7908096.1 RpiB/LacA/LacB family sugar-phosphate isomerase [Akkermansiaceae bacterium]MDA7929379.1 RpiB/LacA/LacB family sugar-phosphate isomerase [Akkermansiaceae bacterium]MDB4509826.1 RpiB/LacA/LacB family sugar-phosphate isomerase [Akkermansiaceae bacterium]